VDPRVEEILERATDIQRRYVRARFLHSSVAEAARAIGIHRSTPGKWANLDELEEAIKLIDIGVIAAAKEKLEGMIPAALDALERAAKGKGGTSVAAARAILDRAGLPAASSVDVTSGGEAIKATIYIPDNGRDRD
jgi:hypothetical protein